MSKRGYTQIPHGFHSRMSEFKDGKSYARLAVWLYHRAREDRGGTSYPSIPRIAKDLKLNDGTVSDARTWLRANGWLVTVGRRAAEDGRFAVPIERTAIPTPLIGVGDQPESFRSDPPESTGVDRPQSTRDGFKQVVSNATTLCKPQASDEPVEAAASHQRSAAQRDATVADAADDCYLEVMAGYVASLEEHGYEAPADLVDVNRIMVRLEAVGIPDQDARVLFLEWIPKAKWVLKATQGRTNWLADRFESDDKRSLLNQFKSFIASRKRHEAKLDSKFTPEEIEGSVLHQVNNYLSTVQPCCGQIGLECVCPCPTCHTPKFECTCEQPKVSFDMEIEEA